MMWDVRCAMLDFGLGNADFLVTLTPKTLTKVVGYAMSDFPLTPKP